MKNVVAGEVCTKLGQGFDLEHNVVRAEIGWGEVVGYLTTKEAARYLRRSVSWLLRQPDIPFVPGKPNLYEQTDLDAWLQKHKIKPRVRV